MNNTDEQELIERAKKGDVKAQADVIKKYGDMIFRAAYRLCDFDRETALDVTQETFCRFLSSVKSFEGRSSLQTWLYRILVNECLKEKKRIALFEKIKDWALRNGSQRREPSPYDQIFEAEMKSSIFNAIGKLSKKQQIAVELKFLEGLTTREIAEIMEITEGAVKSHLARAFEVLRKELKEWKPL
ncbi:RNA polymerase sigma factor [Thermodesulforhabdus norvegica]|uniref:RNA polymerase sigma-70 factor, ECF subfamily n=1 Tax=Thermodesulforhabdus norvegica TaxID=39841 RepID=A0A1I4V228_9BACT|nr:RNA polymerase sigma factor [Thermodesulforhabdus norvegica]SFM95242.1 RNA polymerase sigma-70 factor, ECF subfamily [Thermodesulforhabdus norvegica]